MCKKVGNTCKQLPLTAGYWFFKKLHGSIEDKFPCRYFWGRVKNKKLDRSEEHTSELQSPQKSRMPSSA